MHRREFLIAAAAAGAASTIGGRLFAAPGSSPRFLLIFLRGGYDCANVLVPYSSNFYYESRPNIAIAKPDSTASQGALALDGIWALAPALRETIAPWYASKQIAFIPFAGTDDLSRSHFETQDSIERGQPANGQHSFESGFLARLSLLLQRNGAIAFTDSLPLAFKGSNEVPNISLRGAVKPVFDQRQASILTAMYAGNHLQPAVADGLELRQEVAKSMEEEMREANRGAITAQGFELEAKRIGRLMRDQYRLGFVDIGGWDTHVNEGAAQGSLANNLQNLGRGLRAFSQELGDDWKNTIVMVISEFGRTFRENGNRGTDHGHGTVYWVAGGAINGGLIAGEQVRVERTSLFQDRDYPVLNDYRSIMSGIFRRLWSLSDTQMDKVFPESRALDLRLV